MATISKEYTNGSGIKVVYTYTQSETANTSTITASLYIHRDSYGPSWNTRCSAYIKLDGTKILTYTGGFEVGTSWVQIGNSVTKTVSHGADGKKTITLEGYFDSLGLTTKLTDLTVSDDITLKTIPRASSFTLSASSVTIGSDALAVSITPAASSFTHTVTWAIGSHSKATSRVSTSASYTIPTSWLDAIPDSVSGTGKVTVDTYSGTTKIGSASRSFTAKVAADVLPTVGAVSVLRVDADVPAAWSVFIAGHSKAQIRVASCTPGTGSSIQSITISGGGFSKTVQADQANVTTSVLPAGEIAYTVKATDARGRSASVISDPIQVQPYTPPAFSGFSAVHTDETGMESEDGTCLLVVPMYTAASVYGDGGVFNVTGVKACVKAPGDLSYGEEVALDPSTGAILIPSASAESTWEVKVTVSDTFTSIARSAVVKPAQYAIDVHSGGTAVAFGKVSETDGCTDMTGYEKTYLGPQSFLGGEGSALEKKLYFVTPDGVTYPHKVRFYGGNGESQTAVGLYDDAIGESAVGIIWNYNDVLRTLNVKIPLVSNGGISVFDTGITLDQCAYTQLVIKKKSGQNGDAIQFSDCDSGKTNWRVNAYRDVSGTDDSSLRFQADNAGDGSFSSNLILYPGGLVSATGDFEAGGNTTLKGNATVNGWHYVKGQLRLDDEIRLYYNGASSLTGIIYQPNDYTINLGTYNGNGTLRYMQWLGEPSDSKRFVLRPSTNGGGYLGTTSMRWNTGFFTNTITQSDAKDKIHVRDLGQEALSFLSALRPVSFVFKDGEGGRTHLGLIAQEVAGAAEDTGMGDLSLYQAVRLDEEGNEHPYSPQAPDEQLRWGLNYQELIAPLIAAVQQLSRETQQLSREIEDLRDQLSALQQQKEENI